MSQSALEPQVQSAQAPDHALARGYKIAALLYIVGAIPAAIYDAARGEWIVLMILCVFASGVAKMLFELRRGWAKFILIIAPFGVLFGLVALIRHGPSALEMLNFLGSCAFTVCFYLLLLRPPTRAQQLTAIAVFLLVGLPAYLAWLVLRLR
jgi:hypothetical protein